MRLERTSLRERFITAAAFERLYPCVRPNMALQVKGIIETFGTELAMVPLIERMSFHVAIEETLKGERTVANFAFVFRLLAFAALPHLVLVLQIC